MVTAFESCCDRALELACVLKDDVDAIIRKDDPLTTDWIIETEASVADAVRRAVKVHASDQLAALDAAIASWSTASDLDVFLATVGDSMAAIGPAIEPSLTGTFATRAVQIVRRTKEATARTFDFVPSAAKLGGRDEAAAQFIANFQGYWVKNTAGQVSKTLTEKARKIIADGVSKGWGTKEIRAALNEKVAGFAKRAGYADTVANAFANRSRTYAAVATYQDAGVDLYQILAVLDERTTEICRDLDGKIFSVSRAMGKFDQAMKGPLGSAASVLPFASERKTEDGKSQIVVDQGGVATVIADIVEPSGGGRDAIGTYNDRLANSDLEALGLSLPPFHHLCRTTVIPYIV